MKVSIVYDHECPVCRRVVQASRLRGRSDELELIDARTDLVDDVQGNDLSALDFNDGFAVIVDGKVHHGADGAHALAMLTQPSGLLFGVFRWVSRTERRSRVFYPILKAGRRVLLWLLRVPRIGEN